MSVELSACSRCGQVYFPPRQICHRCGGSGWTAITVSHGVLESLTTLLHQVDAEAPVNAYLGAVRTAAGPVLLSRLRVPAAAGTRLSVAQAPSGAILGEPEP